LRPIRKVSVTRIPLSATTVTERVSTPDFWPRRSRFQARALPSLTLIALALPAAI